MPGDGAATSDGCTWHGTSRSTRAGMDVFRESPFTPTQLKSTYPGCVTFPNAEAFHTHIWDVMGLSAEACRLLARIQSADAPSRLDDIFKQGVLGVPEALDLAVRPWRITSVMTRTSEAWRKRPDAWASCVPSPPAMATTSRP